MHTSTICNSSQDPHASVDAAISLTRSNLKTGALDKSLSKIRNDVHISCYALLFSEMVQYCQNRSNSLADLKSRLKEMGKQVGLKSIDLISVRDKNNKRERETRVNAILLFIRSTVWRNLFGKEADKIVHANNDSAQYYIIENEPLVNRFISVPKDKGDLNCAEFCGGIIEGILCTCGFTSKVTVQSLEGATYYIIKFDESVMQRERSLE